MPELDVLEAEFLGPTLAPVLGVVAVHRAGLGLYESPLMRENLSSVLERHLAVAPDREGVLYDRAFGCRETRCLGIQEHHTFRRHRLPFQVIARSHNEKTVRCLAREAVR